MTRTLIVAYTVLALGCSPLPTGDLSLVLEAEGSVTDGLSPGMGEDDVADGWSVAYDTFAVSIGNIRLAQQATGLERRQEGTTVLDLVSAPATGFSLVLLADMPTGVWDIVEFETPAVDAGATRDASVSPTDFDAMVLGGCSYLIAGVLENATGESCPPGGMCVARDRIAFRFCIPAPTRFGPCSGPDGMPGLTIGAGLTTTSAFTIHGDHPFFSSFPSGEELVVRRAQWLANSDVDGDGNVTEAELRALDAASVFRAPDYSLAGAPQPVSTAWDFLVAQVATQGHFNGEGECPALLGAL